MSKSNYKAYKFLKKHIQEQKYDLIHCHTPVAGTLTRLASRKMRNPRVIYTAHGFHFYKGASWKNWFFFFPIEWICAWFTDTIITINKEDFALAKRFLHVADIRYIPGVGVDVKKMKIKSRTKEETKASLGLSSEDIMLLSVGELNENKNHEVIIKAMALLNNSKIHYYIAGNGSLKEHLQNVAQECGIKDNVHFLGYRTDISDLDSATDIFCHPSFREGLSVALMEAIACGCNVICSDIRGNRDLAEDCNNVELFDPRDIKSVANTIKRQLLKKPNDNKGIEKYSIDEVQRQMELIYKNQLR